MSFTGFLPFSHDGLAFSLTPFLPGNRRSFLLHGLGADGGSWALQIPALGEAGFRPIAPDAPGFGHSGYDGGGWNFRRVASQLAGLLVG